MVAAIGFLTLATVIFTTGVRSVLSLEDRYRQENRAVIVLNNTVERIAAQSDCSVAIAKAIFESEFQHSDLAAAGGLRPVAKVTGEDLVLSVERAPGRILAGVTVGVKQ
jgi:hypothetical protein